MSSQGFAGLRVVGFESRRTREMESLITRHGGSPLVAPSMREIPLEANVEAEESARKIVSGEIDVVVFMTGVGADALFQIAEKTFPKPSFIGALSRTAIVARGPKPVAFLKTQGLAPRLTAPEPNTWREVLEVMKGLDVSGKKVAVQEYGVPADGLLDGLKKRGARVTRVPVYRWGLPEDTGPLKRAIREVSDGKADVLLFTNAAQIHHALRLAAEEGLESSFREALSRAAVASIGPVMSENLRDAGLSVDLEAEKSVMGLFIKEASEKCPAILESKRASSGARLEVRSYPVKPFSPGPLADSLFMKACRREKTAATPIWIMRQAGRYMKDYRDLRSRVGFLELCKNPDLACEVTVTAQEKLGVDAAIIFSDILLILEPMGVGLEYAKGDGPCIHRPVRTAADIDRLQPVRPKESLGFVLEAIKKTRSALKPGVPLIGFAGAPFTVVSYLIEGKGASNYLHTKSLMARDPSAWNALMEKVTGDTVLYIEEQVKAGAQAVQIFDSWVGCLSPRDYRESVLPHMKKLFSALSGKAPVIHFGTGTSSLLDLMREAGGEVIGLDWRVDLGTTWDRLGDTAVQGNLDPAVLLADVPSIRRRVKEILDGARGRPGHIFNLGHGVLPQTPYENVTALVDMVHELSRR
ncbi:MAG: uroporphyrinogen decarboxylase [Elusimicrobia bacterium RIFCSPHIGHO2_01_FULL_64_10]|nr:MAG: uroporphyrinogen decarboxylase [Elusimicrobia bacterium RIFCSPHIGHO2_01_FULL_64_10]